MFVSFSGQRSPVLATCLIAINALTFLSIENSLARGALCRRSDRSSSKHLSETCARGSLRLPPLSLCCSADRRPAIPDGQSRSALARNPGHDRTRTDSAATSLTSRSGDGGLSRHAGRRLLASRCLDVPRQGRPSAGARLHPRWGLHDRRGLPALLRRPRACP